MFGKWKKREAAKPKGSESTSLKELGNDELRAKADQCRARVYKSPGLLEFVPTAKAATLFAQFPPISDEERTRLLLEEQSFLSEIDRREDAKVSERDFRLEVAVIVLIGLEILIDLGGLYTDGIDFNRQQTVLTNLEKSSEATASTMVALQKTMETMNAAIQNQLSLNYEVSVGLVVNRAYRVLSITNKGRTNITFWGQKIASEQRHMLSSPLTITPGNTQDVDFASFFEIPGTLPTARQATTVPITIFLRSENGREFAADCPIDTEKLLGGSLTVECQTTTVRASNWSHESR